jgi:hypothetical protein
MQHLEGVGSTVRVADRDGTRTLPIPEDRPSSVAPPLPDGLVNTTYEKMTSHGCHPDVGVRTKTTVEVTDELSAVGPSGIGGSATR